MKEKKILQQQILAFFDSEKENLLNLGSWFWKNPESGYREKKTSTMAIKTLQRLGLTVQQGLAITGFRTIIDTGRPGPTVAVLGELDSLIIPSHPDADPETGAVHACGHNASLTALLGTAMALAKTDLIENLCGKIVLIGCPAEEGIEMEYRLDLIRQGRIKCISGKAELICEGVFQDVDLAFMNHLSINYGYNDHNGCINKKIIFHGKSCHAAFPEEGHNALNAANLALHAIALLRESYSASDKIRIHGIISNGGDAVNVIPDTVAMEYTLRASTVQDITSLNDRFDHIVLHAAMAAECEAESESIKGSLPLYDDPELGKIMENMVQIADPGAPFDANGKYMCSCTDMGDVSVILPAIHGYVPGRSGCSHGKDYQIADPDKAYVKNAAVETLMLLELLYGNAEKAKQIATRKKDCMPIPKYIELIENLNRIASSKEM